MGRYTGASNVLLAIRPEKEESLEELERLLQSRVLHGSETLKAFLRYVVLESINNQDGHLKEYTIAAEVFGRNSDYDPRNDSIVRVQAGRLRSKIQEYYATEGKHDKVLIDLPKGHYNAVFSYARGHNGDSLAVDEQTQAVVAEQAAVTPIRVDSEGRRSSWRGRIPVLSLLGVSIFLLFLAVKYNSEASRLRDSDKGKTGTDTQMDALYPLWGQFLKSDEPILVSYSNTRFQGRPETGMKLLKPLDWQAPAGQKAPASQAGETAGPRSSYITDHYTGVGEVMGVVSLSNLFSKANHTFKVKRSLLLGWDDLKTQNIVVLGSPAENLFLRQLPQDQDFVFRLAKGENQEEKFGIVNLRPRRGEESVYLNKDDAPSTSEISEDYALISLLKGLDRNPNQRLLILAGITTFGTQAAAEYVTNPEYMKELLTHLKTGPSMSGSVPSYYQVLIRIKINGGVPVHIDYVTHHALN
jgi:hypothetical protein